MYAVPRQMWRAYDQSAEHWGPRGVVRLFANEGGRLERARALVDANARPAKRRMAMRSALLRHSRAPPNLSSSMSLRVAGFGGAKAIWGLSGSSTIRTFAWAHPRFICARIDREKSIGTYRFFYWWFHLGARTPGEPFDDPGLWFQSLCLGGGTFGDLGLFGHWLSLGWGARRSLRFAQRRVLAKHILISAAAIGLIPPLGGLLASRWTRRRAHHGAIGGEPAGLLRAAGAAFYLRAASVWSRCSREPGKTEYDHGAALSPSVQPARWSRP